MGMEGFNWDEMKEQLEKAVKLDKNKEDLSITIKVLETNIEENQMVGGMLQGEDEMKRSLGQFMGNNEPLDCDVEINEDEKIVKMTFKKKKEWKKVYELLDNMFFGDFFKKMIEAMMGAFGGMFGGEQ